MNFIQGTLQLMEVGKGSIIVRLVPLITTLAIIVFAVNFSIYKGLGDAQSMDNAQLARQIVRGKGFTTEFLRPHAVSQLRSYSVDQGLQNGKPRDLFPADQFPPGTPRILPDTYNAPGYPYLLAGWFFLLHPDFEQPAAGIGSSTMYAPERWIPFLNQIFLLLTAGLVFLLGRRLFDQRVAWMALVAYLVTDLVWRYTLTALGTSVLMFLITATFYCLQEIFKVGEACFDSEERSFMPAWYWGFLAVLLLIAACLTQLQLLAILAAIVVMLLVMPNSSVLLTICIPVLVLAAVAPWYIHLDSISGSYLGSNAPMMLYGTGEYEGNQIFCTTAIPTYEQIFANVVRKEWVGLLWNFQHAWMLLGTSPFVLLFGVSILHQFKRRRARLFHWLIFASAIAIVGVNNLGRNNPEAIDSWNGLVLLLPAMIVIGSAFFFILLDRLSLQLWLLNNLIITAALLLAATPLVIALTHLTGGSFYPFNFPPYWPPTIKQASQLAQADEWVTTDMPWATAWYGDRASLWLPDQLADFENFHDNVCPSGIIIFTGVTWDAPMSNLTTGEYRDWLPLMTGVGRPENFPLPEHYSTPGKVPSYTLWSDRPRWQEK